MIVREGDAEPGLPGGDHGAAHEAGGDEVVDCLGEVEFTVEAGAGSDELGKEMSQGPQNARDRFADRFGMESVTGTVTKRRLPRKTPEIHGDRSVHGHVNRPSGHIATPDPVSGAAQFQALGQPLKSARFVDFADAPGDSAAVGEGDFEGVADDQGGGGGVVSPASLSRASAETGAPVIASARVAYAPRP